MGITSPVSLCEAIQIFRQLQYQLPQDHTWRQRRAGLFKANQLSGVVEPHAGFKSQSRIHILSIGQLHYFRIFAQRPQQLLLKFVYRKYQKLYRKRHMASARQQVVHIHYRQHIAAHPRLHTRGIIPQCFSVVVTGISIQAQTPHRTGTMV